MGYYLFFWLHSVGAAETDQIIVYISRWTFVSEGLKLHSSTFQSLVAVIYILYRLFPF